TASIFLWRLSVAHTNGSDLPEQLQSSFSRDEGDDQTGPEHFWQSVVRPRSEADARYLHEWRHQRLAYPFMPGKRRSVSIATMRFLLFLRHELVLALGVNPRP